MEELYDWEIRLNENFKLDFSFFLIKMPKILKALLGIYFFSVFDSYYLVSLIALFEIGLDITYGYFLF
jgi:hypothetical protein